MNITSKELLKQAIVKASFASFTYEAKSTGEIARHTIQLGTNYLNMLEKSLLECRLLDLNEIDSTKGLPMRQAKAKVLKSLRKSIRAHKQGKQNENYTKKHVYTHEGKGITTHNFDQSIEIHGYSHKKHVIKEGIHKKVNSRPLTIAKNLIEKQLPKSKWRTFSFENLEKAKLAGIEFV